VHRLRHGTPATRFRASLRSVIENVLRALEEQLGPAETEPAPLGGGQTNSIYRVRFGGRECVVRLPGKDTALLGIDRETERAASVAAARLGIGPGVMASAPCLVTAFIDARPVPAGELRYRLPEVAALLRAVHAGPPLPTSFSPFELTARYERTARERGGAIPASYPELRAAAEAIEEVLDGGPRVPCHNDLLTANFLDDGTRLRLLDWEYAGMNDPYFDLGNFASHHDLEPDGEAALLEAYGGDSLARLRLMRVMAAFWEGMWGVVQATCSQLDIDYLGYAEQHLAKLRGRLADLPTWLEDARAA
jgi:thiamine kinase-like enzyme